jgi:hypothetical protein
MTAHDDDTYEQLAHPEACVVADKAPTRSSLIQATPAVAPSRTATAPETLVRCFEDDTCDGACGSLWF